MAFNPIWLIVLAVLFYLFYDLFYRVGMVKEIKIMKETLEDMFVCQREILNVIKRGGKDS